MATYRGTIKKNDLEGGFWELVCEDNSRYQLRGGSDELRVEGLAVEIEGSVDREAFGIGMTGTHLDIKSWQKT